MLEIKFPPWKITTMLFPIAWTRARLLTILALAVLLARPLTAAPTGPTLQFAYDQDRPLDNPLTGFMYFVPLISPEHVALSTNLGNTQCARVISCRCRTNGVSFEAECEFTFVGDGLLRNAFSHDAIIKRRQKDLESGKGLLHQLTAISVEGSGEGSVEVEGTFTNGQPVVSEMRIKFNGHGHASPVTVDLQDIVLRDGALHYENEMVARVNMLTFQQKSDSPKMEVTLASVKRKDAGNGLWANFVGNIKGAAANLLLPPLSITVDGHQAMLDFGLALAMQKSSFTFPFASRLTNGPAIGL
jgi:hypothetical protein